MMAPAVWRWLPLFVWISCFVPAAAAPPAADADARALLARIQAAADNANYQGIMVFTVGGTVSSSRVLHFAVGAQTFEQLDSLDGRLQRVLRHNDAVHTVLPEIRLAVVEKREILTVAKSSTPQSVEPSALEQYEFKREAVGRVAGREAQIFLLEPRDALRYAQRLWADQATGLMLRADVLALGPTGSVRPVIESTQFSEIVIGIRPQPEAVLQEIRNLRKLDGYRIVKPQQQRTSLDAEGWTLARPVPGFALAGCVRRGMDTTGDQEPVLQAVFTDGLTHVSLFVEPFNPQRHKDELQARQGATGTLMTRRGEHWITAVGDVPPATLKRLVDALERRRP